ncbi:MAG: 3'-5' exonuclease [Chloroherpetonaceae bacterium]|nr:3'-5' exonuclease [Chloroherpetonaceae bacterium]
MSTWLVPRSELTPDQLRAVELPHREHQVIYGVPGSGKTMVLLHRAHELRQRMGSSPEKFRIMVFTNVLKEYIRSGLTLLNLPERVVTTFDSWCVGFYKKYIDSEVPCRDGEQPDYVAIRRAVAEWTREYPGPPLFDFVMVDEGQDLNRTCFEILRRVARHVTVCMDYRQRIYSAGATENEVLRCFGPRYRQVRFLHAYRCSPYVAQLAAQLLETPEEQEKYMGQVRTVQKERETPLLYVARDSEDEKKRLIEVLRQRLLVDRRIAVLLPRRKQVSEIVAELELAGISVERQGNLQFASECPKVVTIHSAKGLSFETVLLPCLVQSSFLDELSDETVRNMLFVAITRAERWVYLSTVQDEMYPIVKRLESLAVRRKAPLTVQYSVEALDVFDDLGELEREDALDFL